MCTKLILKWRHFPRWLLVRTCCFRFHRMKLSKSLLDVGPYNLKQSTMTFFDRIHWKKPTCIHSNECKNFMRWIKLCHKSEWITTTSNERIFNYRYFFDCVDFHEVLCRIHMMLFCLQLDTILIPLISLPLDFIESKIVDQIRMVVSFIL